MIKTRRGFFKSALAIGALPLALNADEKKAEKSREDNLKFIHITDSHMDLSDEESVEAIKLMVKFINKNYKDLDFVLFGGDNFNNNVKGNSDALTFKEIISKLHCPSYLVRGNKESSPKIDDNIQLDEFKKLFMNDKALTVKGKDWLLEKKGYMILGLDSCIENANNGLYTEETIRFAEETLKRGKPTIILNHHPYTNYWKGTKKEDIHKYVLNNTKEVQKRIFGYSNLILTLSGHKHIDSVTQINKTKVIVTRGFIRPLDLEQYPMRFVELSRDKITQKLIYTA
ncbi:Serine/threonine protein kinase related protein [hydrothermal vent metagenome]|uniref:Serine/threonine protein kinase related protein n=1 Tax=hydrothermal vent metagenome TaxID=652676 RepID=A0A1W1CEL6_9ZZZZ